MWPVRYVAIASTVFGATPAAASARPTTTVVAGSPLPSRPATYPPFVTFDASHVAAQRAGGGGGAATEGRTAATASSTARTTRDLIDAFSPDRDTHPGDDEALRTNGE